ncbi:MAG: hypothetical protein HZC55_08410 [Verrucomicrobia bacterium]|nr:hypothetical protein [Verrucomicrobiota bacterium]
MSLRLAWRTILLGILGCGAAANAGHAAPIEIRWVGNGPSAWVEVVGLPPGLGRALPPDALLVFAEQESGAKIPPMAGTMHRDEARVRFEPRFPLVRGLRYRAEFRTAPDATPLVAPFRLPAEAVAPSTVVTQIFPSADTLPENQLKFYVHFSAPMARGVAYRHLRLRSGSGAEIELPFLELEEELWDQPMTRLTLLIDPGRIKRGVKPLEDLGPVFEAGREYTLEIAAEWRDAAGRPLRERFEKKFRAGLADRDPPDPRRWQIRAPVDATRDALVVDFDEPMDQALARRLIRVETASGQVVSGETELTNQERRWRFFPAVPWSRGDYRLGVAATIEDLAGNNIGKRFDVDLREGGPRRLEEPVVRLAFTVQ